jgi:hypothetical protein
MVPVPIIERLTEVLAKWDGRAPGEDEALEAGKRMANAIMALLTWNSQQ